MFITDVTRALADKLIERTLFQFNRRSRLKGHTQSLEDETVHESLSTPLKVPYGSAGDELRRVSQQQRQVPNTKVSGTHGVQE